MPIAKLRNGSQHNSYDVDDMMQAINIVRTKPEGLRLLSVLHHIATDYYDQTESTPQSKEALIKAELLQANGEPTQIVRDIMESLGEGWDEDLKYH